MPITVLKTIQQIVDYLNEGETPDNKAWVDTGEYYGCLKIEIENVGIRSNAGKTLVLRVFYNGKTGEVRYFLAKSIVDLPEEDKKALG